MSASNQLRFHWVGLEFALDLTDGISGEIYAVQFPDSYFGEARVFPGTQEIEFLSLTTPWGTFDGYLGGMQIDQIFIRLVSNGLPVSPTLLEDKENLNPALVLEFFNNNLN